MKERKKEKNNFALDICTKEKACPYDIPEKTKKTNHVRSIRSLSPQQQSDFSGQYSDLGEFNTEFSDIMEPQEAKPAENTQNNFQIKLIPLAPQNQRYEAVVPDVPENRNKNGMSFDQRSIEINVEQLSLDEPLQLSEGGSEFSF